MNTAKHHLQKSFRDESPLKPRAVKDLPSDCIALSPVSTAQRHLALTPLKEYLRRCAGVTQTAKLTVQVLDAFSKFVRSFTASEES